MSAELLIANFLRIASEDLDGARLLAAAHNRNAIYLCEQAAEKVIRAVVTSQNKHAGIKHDLAEMVDLISDDNPLKPSLRAIEHLSVRDHLPLPRHIEPSQADHPGAERQGVAGRDRRDGTRTRGSGHVLCRRPRAGHAGHDPWPELI